MNRNHTAALIEAIERLSTGTNTAPTGFEALCMALCGPGIPGHDSVAAGLRDVADAIRELGEAVRADEVSGHPPGGHKGTTDAAEGEARPCRQRRIANCDLWKP